MTTPPPQHPTVTRVHTDTGCHVEPALDPEWDDLTKLRWHAAVTAHDTGLPVTVREGGLATRGADGELRPVPGTYSISVGATSSGGFDYHAARVWLTGAATGANETARMYGAPPDCH